MTADGGVFSFGSAAFHGSMFDSSVDGPSGGTAATGPVSGVALDQATGGYWLVTQHGAVYGFDAPLHGSLVGTSLNAPIVGIVPTPGDHGYWLVGADGGVFAFGTATFYGSGPGLPANERPNAPAVGIGVS